MSQETFLGYMRSVLLAPKVEGGIVFANPELTFQRFLHVTYNATERCITYRRGLNSDNNFWFSINIS